jgi:hypothetical protein
MTGPRQRNALLFAAGKLERFVIDLIFQFQKPQNFATSVSASLAVSGMNSLG